MRRPAAPPPANFFERPRPAQGRGALTLRLDDLVLGIRGLGDALEERLRARFGLFAPGGDGGEASLRIDLAVESTDYFIDPPEVPELNPVLLAVDGDRVRYLGYRVAGWFDTLGGRGQILLARGDYEPAAHAVENFVRAAVAWQAACRGGALVHGASAVWRDRAYLFYGESGAGKSTLSASQNRGRVVSDDLTLVLPDSCGRPEVIGSPFRGTYEGGDPVTGRFPLAAGFRIIKDRESAVRPVPRLRAMAELVGNLPFVADAFPSRPDLFERVEQTFATCPLSHLHFRKDDSFWDAIDSAGL